MWVDLGMPVRATTDGRLYKPLFAILCVDLDGRINLNAHGSLAQSNSSYTSGTATTPSGNVFAGGTSTSTTAGGSMSLPANYPRGLGFGPAEISPLNVLSPSGDTVTGAKLYNQLLAGGTTSGTTTYEGRYGSTKVPRSDTQVPGRVLANKWFEYAQNNGYGTNYWQFITAPISATVNDAGSYGSPPDPFGVGAVGLDAAGRPVYAGMTYGVGGTYLGFGCGIGVAPYLPYEMNLSPNIAHGLASTTSTTINNPFSPAELEALLRPFDGDAATLPSRLATLTSPNITPASSVLIANRNLQKTFTTESWDVPCPATAGLLSLDTRRHRPAAISPTSPPRGW